MEQPQRGLNRHAQRPHRRAPLHRVRPFGQRGLAHLDVPVAQLAPEEAIQRLRTIGKLTRRKRLIDFFGDCLQPRQDVAVAQAQLHRAAPRSSLDLKGPLALQHRIAEARQEIDLRVAHVHQEEPHRAPDLVHEVAVAIHARHRQADVATLRAHHQQEEAQRIGPLTRKPGRIRRRRPRERLFELGQRLVQVLFRGLLVLGKPEDLRHRRAMHEAQRVDDVALHLGHLLAVFIDDQRVQHHGPKRHLLHKVQPEHHHARDPEKQDVVPRLHHCGRVKRLQVARLIRPAQRRERPQRRAKPGIQHVVVLHQIRAACLRAGFLKRARHEHLACALPRAFGHVPRRDAMSPPQLAADAPVADVAHPAVVVVGPVLRDKLGLALLDGGDGVFGQRLGLDKPLHGQRRLDHRIAALTAAQRQLVRLLFDQQPLGLQRL